MRVSRPVSLLATLAALAIFSAVAAADHSNDSEDLYDGALQANAPGEPLGDAFHIGDNTGYNPTPGVDAEREVLPGGFLEPDDCNGFTYGRTAWYEAHPDVNGIIVAEVAGESAPLDAVVTSFLFNPTTGVPADEYECTDATDSTSATESHEFSVSRGASYKIQVGGFPPADQAPYRIDVSFIPDTDADGVYDFRDACPTVFGRLSNGCPAPPPPRGAPDRDSDGIADSRDRCPAESSRARDANLNGCLDLDRINAKFRWKPGSYLGRDGRPKGLKVAKLSVRAAPSGSLIVASCSKKACKRQRKRADSRGRASFGALRKVKLKAGVRLTIRVVKSGYVGDARIFKVGRNSFRSADRCLSPGSQRLQKTCSTIR